MKIFIITVLFVFSTIFASSLSKSCIDEFVNLPKTKADFDLEQFLNELPAEVLKVKAQLKLPFGKPADDKKTDIGITAGCLKQFPESANTIAPMLKDLGIAIAKDIAENKLGIKENKLASAENESAKNQNIIYMRSGQEVKNAIISEIGIDELKYQVGTRGIVYIAKKTDVSSILYADGEQDFFCNGISYNSATHFCHTDSKTYSCGNKAYNPATQSCSNNTIYAECGNKHYNIATQFCFDNIIYGKCGDKSYNPATQSCSGNTIYGKCNDFYDKTTYFCHTDGKTYSCGNKPYNPATHFCHTDGKTYSCGDKPYNPATHYCARQNIMQK